MNSQRFPYTAHPQFPVGIPLLNIQLAHHSTTITVTAVVDSGAALNILPYDVGKSLNLDWDSQTYPLDLGFWSVHRLMLFYFKQRLMVFPLSDWPLPGSVNPVQRCVFC